MSKCYQLFVKSFNGGLLGSASWLGLSAATSRGVLLVGGFIIARSFGVEFFALYSFLIATVGIATVFSNFGLGLTITKIISDPKSKKISVESFVGTSRLFVLIFSTIFSFTISFNLNNIASILIENSYMQSSYFVFFAIILYTLIGIESSILIGCKKFKTFGLVNFSTGILQLTLIIFYSLRNEFDSVLIATILTTLLNYILMVFFSRKSLSKIGICPRIRIDKNIFYLIKQYSFPLFLSSLFYAPTIWLASAVIVNAPDGTLAIGYFYAADNLRGLLLFFAAMVAQASLPFLSEHSGEEHIVRFKYFVRMILYLVTGLTSAIVTILFFLSPFILKLYGLDNDVASNVMLIILVSSVFASINNVFGQVLLAKHKTWEGLAFNFIWSISLLMTTISLIWFNYTLIAVPIGLLLSYTIITIFQYCFINYNLKIKLFGGG